MTAMTEKREWFRSIGYASGAEHRLYVCEDGEGWRVECSCGYTTAWKKDREDAMDAAHRGHALPLRGETRGRN